MENTAAFLQTNSKLRQQVSLLNAHITQMQQQLLIYQCPVQPPVTVPAAPAAKKILKKTLTKKSTTGEDTAKKVAATDIATPAVALATPPAPPTSTRGWETILSGIQKQKTPTPKLIPTKYPQAEREVTCHFPNSNTNETANILPDKTYAEREAVADTALRHVNAALVENKDVLVPPFI